MSGRLARLRKMAREHPKSTFTIGTAGVVLLVFVLVWFQPQTLFLDTVVEDDFPQAGPTTTQLPPENSIPNDDDPSDEPADEPEPTGPVALVTGEFGSRSRYTVTGTATVFLLEDGTRVLRLEDFSSTNGPDLYVYLTVADSMDDDVALNMEFVDLGLLAGNIGNQNYAIPDDVDLDLYDTVVIWCRRFTVGFGAADLMGVP